jgi:hypothetical protein
LAEAAASGLDVAGSERQVSETRVDFHFSYDDARFQSISASGFIDARSQKLSADFSFEMDESAITPGAAGNRRFRFQMHLEIQADSFDQTTGRIEKESLPDFLYRIVQTIAKFARSKNKQIAALILDKEDMAELASFENGKMLKEIIALIGIIYNTNRMLDRDREDVAVYIKRGKSLAVDETRIDQKGFKLDIRIDEIQGDSATETPEIKQTQTVGKDASVKSSSDQ